MVFRPRWVNAGDSGVTSFCPSHKQVDSFDSGQLASRCRRAFRVCKAANVETFLSPASTAPGGEPEQLHHLRGADRRVFR